MTKVQALWMDWTRDGRGWYLVNDPEVTFYGEEEAMAYCDEHNRALAENALAENARLRAENAGLRAVNAELFVLAHS